MAQIKTVSVDIRRNEMTTIHVIVPAWEFPILQALYGRVKVEKKGEDVKELDSVPNAEVEFDRLGARYGRERREDGSLGMPLVEAVYGQFQPGLMNLERSIDAAKVSAGG